MLERSEKRKQKEPNFVKIIGKERLQSVMECITKATGMGIAAVDYCGNPVAGAVGYSTFCKNIQGNPARKRLCEASTAIGEIQGATLHEPYVYVCPQGLLEVAIPIVINGEFLGGIIGGQIRCSTDIPEEISRTDSIFPKNLICRETFINEFLETKEMTFEEFEATAHMISCMLTQIFEARSEAVNNDEEHDAGVLKAQEVLIEDRIAVMRMKMQQSFILGSISSIANMAAVEDAVKTNEMAGILSDFLYEDGGDDDENSRFLCDELKAMENYLTLEQQRISNLTYTIDVPEEMMLARIPTMLLFPAIRQSIYQGIRYKQGSGSLKISAEQSDEYITIYVCDDGLGLNYRELRAMFPQVKKEELEGMEDDGIHQVRRRLELLFGNNCNVEVNMRNGEGMQAIISYPRTYAEGENL